MYYRRALQPGGCYFFTVNLGDRDKTLLISHIRSDGLFCRLG